MNYINLDKMITKDNINGKIFLFYGEEKYLRTQYIAKIKKCFDNLIKGINYILLEDTSIDNLVNEINSPAFGFSEKLIICNNSKLFKQKKSKSTETENLDDEDAISSGSEADILEFLEKNTLQNVTIIFNEEDIAKTKKIYKLIDKIGIVNEFKQQTQNDLIKYVLEICPKYRVAISRDVATYFIEICNNSIEDVNNELSKLVYLVGQNQEITKQHIDLVTTKAIDAIVFDLTDKLGQKDIKSAVQILDELLAQKEPLQKIYIMLYRHYKNLYYAKLVQSNKIGNVETVLELNPYVAKKIIEQSKNYTLEEIYKMYKNFMLIDINNKQGNADLYTSILQVVCSI